MRLRRLIWFVVMIGIGAAAGIFYGWALRPTQTSGFALYTLRSDYKADFVLMTAEIYQKDGDLGAALGRLAALEDISPLLQVQQAILTGQQLGYARSDIETLALFFQSLQKGLLSLTATPPP